VLNTPFATTLALRLNQILSPTGSVSMNSQKITSLANPTLTTDALNLGYATTIISGSGIALTGEVTGIGTISGGVPTTIVSKLNQISVATGAVNLNSQNLGSVANLGVFNTPLPVT